MKFKIEEIGRKLKLFVTRKLWMIQQILNCLSLIIFRGEKGLWQTQSEFLDLGAWKVFFKIVFFLNYSSKTAYKGQF